LAVVDDDDNADDNENDGPDEDSGKIPAPWVHGPVCKWEKWWESVSAEIWMPLLRTALEDAPPDACLPAGLVAELLRDQAEATRDRPEPEPTAPEPPAPPAHGATSVRSAPMTKAGKLEVRALDGRLVAVWTTGTTTASTKFGRTAASDARVWVARDDGSLVGWYQIRFWGALVKTLRPNAWTVGRVKLSQRGAHRFVRADAATEARLLAQLPEKGR
jgi:hypothetical protein